MNNLAELPVITGRHVRCKYYHATKRILVLAPDWALTINNVDINNAANVLNQFNLIGRGNWMDCGNYHQAEFEFLP